MSALQVEIAKEPVTVGRAGKVEGWLVRVNQQVKQGDKIALFDDGKAGLVEITAPHSGRIVSQLRAGLPIDAGATIALLEPDCPQEPLKRSISIAPSPTTHRPPIAQPAPNSAVCAPSAQEPAPIERRSTLGDEAELMAVEELAIPAPLPKPEEHEEKRTTLRNYCVGSHQELAILLYVTDRNARVVRAGKGKRINESEVVRVALEMFLALPDSARDAMIDQNRAKEAREKWGTGRPRPGRGRK